MGIGYLSSSTLLRVPMNKGGTEQSEHRRALKTGRGPLNAETEGPKAQNPKPQTHTLNRKMTSELRIRIDPMGQQDLSYPWVRREGAHVERVATFVITDDRSIMGQKHLHGRGITEVSSNGEDRGAVHVLD